MFGTSSGGIIALQVAESYPKFVDRIVIHEIPILSVLQEESIQKVDAGYKIYQTYLEHGAEIALLQFRSSVTGKPEDPVPNTPALKAPESHHLDFFFRYEFLVFHIYTPNLRKVRNSGVTVATVEGEESKGVFSCHISTGTVGNIALYACHMARGSRSVRDRSDNVCSRIA